MLGTLLTLLVSMGTLEPMIHTTDKDTAYTFAVIGDTQSRKYIMKRAAKSINKNKSLEFVAHIGDMDWCGSKALWKRSKKIIKTTSLPWHYAVGNHELYGCFLPFRYSHTRGRWGKFWLGRTDTLTVFSKGEKTFIFADSSSYLYPKAHLARIEKILKHAKNNSVFLFTHRPLPYHNKYKVIRHGRKNSFKHSYKAMSPTVFRGRNKKLWKVLKANKNKISAVFHGHYHAYRDYKLDGIQVYSSGGGGGTLETRQDFYHYLTVTVSGDKFTVNVVRL